MQGKTDILVKVCTAWEGIPFYIKIIKMKGNVKMITVNVNAPSLRPKSNPEDMDKIRELYQYLDCQLSGLVEKMQELGCEKLEIMVDTAENAAKEQ